MIKSWDYNSSFRVIARFYSTDKFHVLANKLDDLFSNNSIEGYQISGRIIPCRILNASPITKNLDPKKYNIRKLHSYECQFDVIINKDQGMSCAEFAMDVIKPYLDKTNSIVSMVINTTRKD